MSQFLAVENYRINKKMTKILLSFDYELFFNEQYRTDYEVLIEPTYQILDVLGSNDVKGTFFIDTCMLKRFVEISYEKTYEDIIEQINDIYNNDMEIGLHMHMIWHTAEFCNGNWKFRSSDYMPDAHSDEDIIGEINYGIGLLNDIATQNFKENIISFRAGGFSYEPSGLLFNYLYNKGVRIDSSVCKYNFMFAENQHYDYRAIPNKPCWIIKDGNLSRENIQSIKKELDKTPHMLEIPVTATRDIPFKWGINRVHRAIKTELKGKPSECIYSNTWTRKYESILRKIRGGSFLNCDWTDYRSSVDLIKHITKGKSDFLVVMIGHPKLQSKETIDNLNKFISHSKNELDCEYVTMRDIYNNFKYNKGV